MRWPDIFFKAKPIQARQPERPPIAPAPVPPDDKSAAPLTETPPQTASIAVPPAPVPLPAESAISAPRNPIRLPVSQVTLPPAPVHPPAPDTSVVRDMDEADTLRALTRTGGVRLVKRSFDGPSGLASLPSEAAPSPSPVSEKEEKKDADPTSAPASAAPIPEAPITSNQGPAAAAPKPFPGINLSGLKTTTPPVDPPSSGLSIFRRRTKIADVARIVLPPRRDEAERNSGTVPAPGDATLPVTPAPSASSPPTPPAPSAAVMPPSFTVEVPAGTVMQTESAERLSPAETPSDEKKVREDRPATIHLPDTPVEKKDSVTESAVPESARNELVSDKTATPPSAATPEPEKKEAVAPEKPPMPAEAPAPNLSSVSKPPTTPLPKMGDSSERPVTDSAAPSTALQSSDGREKREFLLSNGERILGTILSETPEAIYIDHGTLGVLTIPRSQIAQRPIEIILINGDRIVGDIVAETTDALFVRHASLGILTVPHNQRSTRVVEAILKDGDRILGEVLGETENFTVIRSATLGTVAVPHNRVAMLNRKVEQIQMKALPPSAPELENKPAS